MNQEKYGNVYQQEIFGSFPSLHSGSQFNFDQPTCEANHGDEEEEDDQKAQGAVTAANDA